MSYRCMVSSLDLPPIQNASGNVFVFWNITVAAYSSVAEFSCSAQHFQCHGIPNLRVCASNLSCHGISTFLVEKWSRCAPLITGFWGPKNPVIRGGRKTRVTSHKKSEFLGQKWPFFGGTIFYTIWVKGQLLGVNGPKLAHFYPQNRGWFFSFYPSKNAFQCFGYGKLENFRDRSVTGSRPSPNNLPPIWHYSKD